MALNREEMIEKIRLLEEIEIRKERARIIPKLAFLYQPMRYKVARGGRGSGKSWEFARALLKLGVENPLRILCTREVQKSIKDSVHKLLSDQIQKLGFGHLYDVFDTEIRGKNGTLFIFAGLAQHTVESIKSYEGVDIVWIEEAQAVTKRSWDVLVPTIRKDGSEIWVSYNPELESDITHQMFAVNPPDNCVSVLVNYCDNPFFPPVLELERIRCKAIDPKEYDNIWEGVPKSAVAGAIYYDEIINVEKNGQVCNLPYDPMLKVHVVLDLGFNDCMAIGLVQKLRSEIRIIDYIEGTGRKMDSYSTELKEKGLNWGRVWLPHDGFSQDHKGPSTYEIMTALGWDCATKEEVTILRSVEEGIRATRLLMGQMYFDKTKTERLMQCIKRYRRAINQTTQTAGAPLHDEYSNGADMLRYLAINAPSMINANIQSTPLSRIKRANARVV